ncbi:hypothetical protein RUM44_003005 [Polyplax serrata]|uniref:Cytochrome c oxidase assembly protein COX16 homolog, mitochondrial n=1 Tax=Polyplax serrata TaxID=468196 RepID=A0ABR1AXB1_POLSC
MLCGILCKWYFSSYISSTILLGIVMLRISQSIRYEFRRVKTLTSEELEYYQSKGINVNKPVKIEEFYEEIKDLADQEWENVRIPRPWEETPTK